MFRVNPTLTNITHNDLTQMKYTQW